MVDERTKKLAKLLVEHSTKVKKGERVVINGDVIAEPLLKEVYRLCLKKGAYPAVHAHLPGMSPLYYKNASTTQLKHFPDVAMYESKKADVFIGIWGTQNTRELSGVDPKKIAIRSKTVNPISILLGVLGVVFAFLLVLRKRSDLLKKKKKWSLQIQKKICSIPFLHTSGH